MKKFNKYLRTELIIASFTVIWSALTIIALSIGTRFNWPDYVHVKYGFPLVWAAHILSMITGPVDIWRVDISNLIIDLSFWLGLMVIILIVMLHMLSRMSRAFEI